MKSNTHLEFIFSFIKKMIYCLYCTLEDEFLPACEMACCIMFSCTLRLLVCWTCLTKMGLTCINKVTPKLSAKRQSGTCKRYSRNCQEKIVLIQNRSLLNSQQIVQPTNPTKGYQIRYYNILCYNNNILVLLWVSSAT